MENSVIISRLDLISIKNEYQLKCILASRGMPFDGTFSMKEKESIIYKVEVCRHNESLIYSWVTK